MRNKYFGTDGIRGTVNKGNITGEKFFKFGLASGTYFKNQKKNNRRARTSAACENHLQHQQQVSYRYSQRQNPRRVVYLFKFWNVLTATQKGWISNYKF